MARRLVLRWTDCAGCEWHGEPALAVEWQSDDNDHRWQFRLRPGVHFHDGSPLNLSGRGHGAEHCPARELPLDGGSRRGLASGLHQRLADAQSARVARGAMRSSSRSRAPPTGKRRPTPSAPGRFSSRASNNGVLTLTANEGCWQGRPFVDEIVIRAESADPRPMARPERGPRRRC